MARPVSRRGTGLQTVQTAQALEAALEPVRLRGLRVGFVPTMGALHAGHLSLVERARQECDVVVVSIFVNPRQFDEQADLDAYPRRADRDRELLAAAGVDLLFLPSAAEIYPPGFATTVAVGGPSERFEGEVRGSGHFQGVATVVLKLLNLVRPHHLYLGQKDAQQVAVLRRMVRDLNVGVQLVVCPTVREADGLALSSRNERLDPEERSRAAAIYRGLSAAAERCAAGERRVDRLLEAARARLTEAGVEPEYLAVVEEEGFAQLQQLDRPALLVVAARLGRTRLIDNIPLQPVAVTTAAAPQEALCNA